jgi:hypothetical protein
MVKQKLQKYTFYLTETIKKGLENYMVSHGLMSMAEVMRIAIRELLKADVKTS